jgi:hypothetical protein
LKPPATRPPGCSVSIAQTDLDRLRHIADDVRDGLDHVRQRAALTPFAIDGGITLQAWRR